jgi:hypothetical protein
VFIAPTFLSNHLVRLETAEDGGIMVNHQAYTTDQLMQKLGELFGAAFAAERPVAAPIAASAPQPRPNRLPAAEASPEKPRKNGARTGKYSPVTPRRPAASAGTAPQALRQCRVLRKLRAPKSNKVLCPPNPNRESRFLCPKEKLARRNQE